MTDWRSSMKQTFEYYTVDPGTWGNKRMLDKVESSSINFDLSNSMLGHASIQSPEALDEEYVRIYLVTIQNGVSEKYPLGTFLVQSPSTRFDGKKETISMDAYTSLIELNEKMPAFGYSILREQNIMDIATKLCKENTRAPVVGAENDEKLPDDFVANTNDTWLTFLSDLISCAKYRFDIDDMGRILFAPKQDLSALQPVWTFDDSNSSILYPDVTVERDLYGIPNVVEVLCSSGSGYLYSRVVNDDPNSPISTVKRGREVVHRVSDPELIGVPTQKQIDDYAEQLLKSLSALEYKITYEHGYCPVRIGDCVRFNYFRAGLNGIKAQVTSQSIKCEPGCPVTETAIFTTKLWG